MSREDIEEAIEVLEDASAEMLTETGNENYYSEAIAALRQALETEQEPVAWKHTFIEGNVITHIPADIGRHPERWTALYKDPTPCKTCESLAMAVMNDQTYHEKVIPKREWVGLNHFDRTLLRTTYAPLKRLHHIKETKTDIVAEIVNDWDAFFTAIEAKLKEGNTYDAAAAIRSRG